MGRGGKWGLGIPCPSPLVLIENVNMFWQGHFWFHVMLTGKWDNAVHM